MVIPGRRREPASPGSMNNGRDSSATTGSSVFIDSGSGLPTSPE